MSRIGKKIRPIPQGVSVEVKDNTIVVKGPKGELKQALVAGITVEVKDNVAEVKIKEGNDSLRALWGTYSSLLGNMIKGVSEGFKKQLEVNGVGYKVSLKGKDLFLELGFSHPIDFKAEDGIAFSVEKNLITVEGIDKKMVGEVAAQIRKLRKPEPYKGKGIKYVDEIIRRKAGKTAGKSE